MSNPFSAEPAAGVATETPRQTLLRLLGLSDTSPEQEFDEIVELATALCGKPLGAMTLLDDDSNYTKGTVGMLASRVPMQDAVCRFTVLADSVMMVEDTHADARFDNHFNTIHCEGGIRFYAGMPLTTVDGTRVGALCVMDTAPSTLTPQQVRALELLGRQISTRLQLRERAALVARMAQEREVASAMFNTILNNLPVEVYLKDSAGRIQFYNQKLAQRFDISTTEWIGKTSHELWDEHIADDIMREDNYVLRSGRSHESFVEIAEPDGRISYWRSMRIPCKIADGEQLLAICSVDISDHMERERHLQQIQDELEEANRKLNSLALTDSLTGLWNRRAFDARLETNVIAAQRNKQSMALMLIDIDNFKTINDRFGHPYGDEVLRHVAAILHRAKRAEDIACRFGGEEFAILMPSTGIEGAESLALRILGSLRAFPWEQDVVTASIGVALCSSSSSSDELVDAADSALYRAKQSGKDRMVCHGHEAAA